MEKPVDVVLVILGRPLAVHLLVVVKKVWVDFVEEPLLFCDGLLQEHKETRADPINKGAGWPLVCERQMEKLEHLEERPEAIDEPVLIFFIDPSLHHKVKYRLHLRLG